MKSKLITSTKGIKNINQYADRLWAEHAKDLKTTGTGEFMPKKQFKAYLSAYYDEAKEAGIKGKRAYKYAAQRYQNSMSYFSAEERVASFTLSDLLQNKEDIKTFQKLTRDAKGRFVKYDPSKLIYKGSFERDGKKYTIQEYGDVILLTFNSPYDRIIIDSNNIPEDYEEYL